MKALLSLQVIDLQIDKCVALEVEIPKQKNTFEIYRKRMQAELEERKEAFERFLLEQKECEGEIEQKQTQIARYEQQLNTIKKNEEYQALLHEIDLLKKQIAIKEERILTLMMELEDAQARLREDEERIKAEMSNLDRQCTEVDEELSKAIQHREELQAGREPLIVRIDDSLIRQYTRIRRGLESGPAVVPMNGEVCGGCHMRIRAQIVNEVLAGDKIHTCTQCSRLLYYPQNYQDEQVGAEETSQS